jgi:uncharacterized RDD family membrane protein YckC
MPEAPASDDYPGRRLGLPRDGSGSLATLGRRVQAILIDWACAVIISIAFFDYAPLATTAIFAVVQILFIPTLGGSPGHRILRLRVERATGGWPGPWRPIVRTLLLVLVIPAVIWDADGRGMHDRAAGTILVRR